MGSVPGIGVALSRHVGQQAGACGHDTTGGIGVRTQILDAGPSGVCLVAWITRVVPTGAAINLLKLVDMVTQRLTPGASHSFTLGTPKPRRFRPTSSAARRTAAPGDVGTLRKGKHPVNYEAPADDDGQEFTLNSVR